MERYGTGMDLCEDLFSVNYIFIFLIFSDDRGQKMSNIVTRWKTIRNSYTGKLFIPLSESNKICLKNVSVRWKFSWKCTSWKTSDQVMMMMMIVFKEKAYFGLCQIITYTHKFKEKRKHFKTDMTNKKNKSSYKYGSKQTMPNGRLASQWCLPNVFLTSMNVVPGHRPLMSST